jgi:putative FmdB family regulatory protein
MTYEYLCTSCGHAWEAEQSISAAALKTCPHCQKDTAKRQVSGGAGFILKGGGWYADLYGSAPPKSGDAKSDAKSEGAKDAPKTDAKPGAAAKTETGTGAAAASPSTKGSDGGSSGSGSSSSGTSSGGSSGSTGTSAA